MSTEWPARRSRDVVLCGRRGPDGTYNCTGRVGTLAIGPLDATDQGSVARGFRAWPVVGYVEVRPGWWMPSRTAVEKVEDDQAPAFKKRLGTGYARRPAALPWRTQCPHCRCIAVVTTDVLVSP